MARMKFRSGFSTTSIALFGLLFSFLLGYIDYITGPEYSIGIFYLLPVLLVTWFAGRGSGIVVALDCAIIWLTADLLWGIRFSNPMIHYWNLLGRLGFFLVSVFLLSKFKIVNQDLNSQAEALRTEMAQRQEAEAALRESEALFGLITDNVADLIAVLDLSGKRLYKSRSYQNILGDPASLRGTDSFKNIHPEDRERIRSLMREIIRTGVGQRTEYRILSRADVIFHLESQWNALRETTGKASRVVVVSRDITERKRAELIFSDEKTILEMIARGEPLPETLRALAQKIGNWTDGLVCSIILAGPTDHPAPRDSLALPLANSSEAAEAAALDQPLSCDDNKPSLPNSLQAAAEPMPEPPLNQDRPVEPGLFSLFSKPITANNGEKLATMALYSRAAQSARHAEPRIIEKAMHIAAIAIERHRAEQAQLQLSSLIVSAQEAERRRVARELHDSVNQLLSLACLSIESLEVPEANHRMKEEVRKAKSLLDKAVQEVRSISENLRPSELDVLGLAAAVRSLCDDFQTRTGKDLELRCSEIPQPLPDDLELNVYRILQEALNNVDKHSRASRVTVQLTTDASSLYLAIQDNGRGLTRDLASTHAGQKPGMGLLVMKERAAILSGTFSIRSAPARGTHIAVQIPLASSGET